MRRRIGNIFANSTTRESHPPNCSPLPPRNPPHTHRRQPAAYARGECEMYKKRSTTTACETPLGGQQLPAFPLHLLLLCLLILLRSRPCRVFDYHARLHAKQRNFRHACRQWKPPATLFFSVPCRLSGAGSKGGGGPQFDGAESCERARAARKIAQNPT